MNLGRGLDKILEVSPEEEVAEIDEFAVVLVFDVDDAPSVLAAANLLAVDDNGLLGANDGEGDQALRSMLVHRLPGHGVAVMVELFGEMKQKRMNSRCLP